MITRSTKTMLAAAVVLLLLILAFEQHRQKVAPHKTIALPKLDAGHLRALELEVAGSTLRLERSDNGWLIVQPFRYPALESLTRTLLEDLSLLQAVNFMPHVADHELEQFGLRPSQLTLRLEGYASNQVLRFGSLTPIPNNVYLRVDNQPGVYVVPNELWYRLPRDVEQWNDWRDRRLAHAGTAWEKIDTIAAHTDIQPLFVLQKNPTNQLWRLVQPAPAKRADSERIQHFLGIAQSWEAAQFITGTHLPAQQVLGLEPALLKLRLAQGTNQHVAIDFGAPHTNAPALVYARDMIFNTLLAVAQTNTVDLLKINPWELFGDHRLVDPMITNQIERIEIKSGTERTVLLHSPTNGTWQLTEPIQAEADTELVNGLLRQLQGLEATALEKDVVTDFAPYQLSNPPLSYTVWRQKPPGAATNTLMAGVDFGRSILESGLTFTRRHDEDMVYLAPTVLPSRLPSRFFQLRDRRLWDFTSSDVAKITLQLGDKTTELARNVRNIWSGPSGQLNLEQNTEANTALASLGRFRATRWVVRGNDKFGDATYEFAKTAEKITFHIRRGAATETHSLVFGKVSLEGERYAAAQAPPDNEHVIFIFPETTYGKVLQLFRAAK